jgi:hypothetical protein
MPIIPPIAPAPTIQIFTRWFLITKEDWSAHRSRAGYPGFCKGALTSRLVRDRGEARDEKSVLNKLRVQPDFVDSPPLRRGVAAFPSREEGSPFPPPVCDTCPFFPPLAKGG